MKTKSKLSKKKITQSDLFRSVASSTAIETGQKIKTLETMLKAKNSKFYHLTLAN